MNRVAVVCLLVVFLGGCFGSVNPFPLISVYPIDTQEIIIFEEYLLGSWISEDDDLEWFFKKGKDGRYNLVIKEKYQKKRNFLIVTLVKLGNEYFLQFYPDLEKSSSSASSGFYPLRSVFRVEMEKAKNLLNIFNVSSKWLGPAREENLLPAYKIDEKDFIFFGLTLKMQDLLRKSGDKLFPEEGVIKFYRKKKYANEVKA